MPRKKNTLILAVVVWPVRMKEAFSYNFWSIVIDQENDKLCEKQEGNYKCIINKEITPASTSRPFEASMLIARYKLACLYEYIKDGVLNVKDVPGVIEFLGDILPNNS
ncbi:hypothetical protein LOD99_451 [Oopsacas minuta]|uniref:Uncharacterized protein n=1 Tax=Oopsacas minuta TaxID=111878 RepID=A0AAV7K9J5_9METZ|nr:hypothetical protein LOD99_451 [Oopsacas minuta]